MHFVSVTLDLAATLQTRASHRSVAAQVPKTSTDFSARPQSAAKERSSSGQLVADGDSSAYQHNFCSRVFTSDVASTCADVCFRGGKLRPAG